MREIKFRGMNLCGKWVYGDLRHDRMCMPDGRLQKYISVCGEPVVPKSVGQLIGLKDSTGKEIYEGDIIASDYADYRALVAFRDGMFVATWGPDKAYQALYGVLRLKGLRVIGNVHDNLELLEVKA